jgi:hypothetical protein
MSNKYEQLVEFIINDETDKARELFHTIVVEKSRDIYESLVSEEDLEETIGGNEVEDLVDEVSLDEEGISEEEDEDNGNMDNMDMDSEEDHHADVGGEEELEDRVVDLESALDELKAEFDALMAGEESEEEAMPGIHGDDDGDVEVMSGMHGDNGAEEMGNEEFYEAEEKDEDDEEDEDKDVDESIVREYVEKVAAPANSEGAAVGTGKSVAVNKKSIVAGKNDMGGTAVTSKGGNANQDGNRPQAGEKPKGTLVSNPQNKPGANAGKSAFKTKEASTGSEGKLAGNDGSVAVNKQSPLRKA